MIDRFENYSVEVYIEKIRQLEAEVKKLRSRTMEDYIRDWIRMETFDRPGGSL